MEVLLGTFQVPTKQFRQQELPRSGWSIANLRIATRAVYRPDNLDGGGNMTKSEREKPLPTADKGTDPKRAWEVMEAAQCRAGSRPKVTATQATASGGATSGRPAIRRPQRSNRPRYTNLLQRALGLRVRQRTRRSQTGAQISKTIKPISNAQRKFVGPARRNTLRRLRRGLAR